MELNVLNEQGQAGGALRVSDGLFSRDYNEALVQQLIVAYQANARSGNRAQMTRAEVRHSTKKPWRQKGTGRARSGMSSSPVWRGGGRTFPNSPAENFSQKLNRKMYRAGMATILSQLNREGRLAVVENFNVDAPKTKLVVSRLKQMGLDAVLLLTDDLNENLMLAARNLPNVLVLEPRHADPYTLVRFPRVLLTKGAVAQFEEMLG